ncbi:uncharacterized protein LOC128989395 [Macrosteles quadrilineatus]|uniref:uncharacterized protein LOC128989395 n=1 Tax=Macrosteles quadrilineatus TaxID=74068 RepID=UPI0023E2A197|nr:uncharacterized protein LOC128989395 [Macrosteles quadrilineatus]
MPDVEHTVLTEFLVNETEDNKVFERVKGGGYRCKLCKTGVNSIVEKITHPYTGRHIGKTIKGMSILDNVACTIQNAIERYPQPLIGTEYIVEYDEQGVFLWYCMLCRKGMNNQDQVLLHLVSKQHRQWYIKHHMPVKHQELLKKTGPVKAEDTLRLLRQIEAKYPNRLPAFGCIYSLDHVIDSGLTIKDVISQKIMDGQHFTVNERGMPQMIYKMPVPLFSEEEQATPGTSSKKKKKKRSRSASSDRSLSPVARQRRLSPEPLELPDLPTEQLKEALIFDWLASQPSTSQPSTSQPSTSQPSTSQPSTSQPRRRAYALMGQVAITKESLEQFIAECDEDNWKSRSQCGCVAELTLTCPLRELLDDDEAFYEVRRVLIGAWMIRLNKDFGWNIQSLDITKDPKLYRLVEIMETGRFVLDVCRPLCRNCVESTAECTLEDFPQYKDIPPDELIDISRGLVNMSNLLHFFYVNIPKSAYTQSE